MSVESRQLYNKAKAASPRLKKAMDRPLLMIVLMLLITGLLALFTASYVKALYSAGCDYNPMYYVSRQAIFAVGGVVAMLMLSRINYHFYGFFNRYFFGVCLFLLLITPFVGQNHKGATRWLGIGKVLTFQPSELMKLAVIISFAWYAAQDEEKIRTFRGLLPYGGALALIAVLLYLEPHMSATIIIFLIGFLILFVAGIKIWYMIPVGVVGGGAALWYIATKGYANDRIMYWLDPFLDLSDKGYQAAMSRIAIGSGGLFGLGLGQGRQKQLFLPEPQNDFVFSAWCEEMGLIGALLVIIMFAYLIFRGFYIARSCRDRFGCLVATGITAQLAIQTLINLFVVTGIMPITGASLPFFSSGGTALLIQLAEIGILLNISRFTTD